MQRSSGRIAAGPRRCEKRGAPGAGGFEVGQQRWTLPGQPAVVSGRPADGRQQRPAAPVFSGKFARPLRISSCLESSPEIGVAGRSFIAHLEAPPLCDSVGATALLVKRVHGRCGALLAAGAVPCRRADLSQTEPAAAYPARSRRGVRVQPATDSGMVAGPPSRMGCPIAVCARVESPRRCARLRSRGRIGRKIEVVEALKRRMLRGRERPTPRPF